MNWPVDETYIRVGGKWRYLWRHRYRGPVGRLPSNRAARCKSSQSLPEKGN
ncbi:MAG: DDE-type integrase/transposase/recombinase [Pseudoruegeria sp.]